ncbi:MAG TPA: hypothetical protein VHV28_08880 [Solirubrobacteraceae bacterium]|nr:hypothetical protein [Solirubrobacteraceae bacterium]
MIDELDRLRDSDPVPGEVTPAPVHELLARIEARGSAPTRRPWRTRVASGVVPVLAAAAAIAVAAVAIVTLGHRGRAGTAPASRSPSTARLPLPKRGMPGVLGVQGAALLPGGAQTISLTQCLPCAAGTPAGQHNRTWNLRIAGDGFTWQGRPPGAVGTVVFMGRDEWTESSRSVAGGATVNQVYVSHDDGVTWQRVARPAGWQVGEIAVSGESVWAVATRRGSNSLVLHGSSSGDHLVPVRAQPIASTNTPIIAAAPGDTAYLDVARAINDVRHLVTRDGGRTWQTLPGFCPLEGADRTLTVDPAGSLWRFCWSGHGSVLLGRSTDGGHTYRSYQVPAPGARGAPGRFQAVSEQVAWEMTDHGDVIRITRGGARSAVVWQQSHSQASTVNGIPEALTVLDANTASVTVVVGPDHRAHTTGSYIVIYTTHDGGRSWTPREVVPPMR